MHCKECHKLLITYEMSPMLRSMGICLECYTKNCISDAVKIYEAATRRMAREIIQLRHWADIESGYKTDWLDEKNIEDLCNQYMDEAQTKA